jgi:hypothetical protein
MKAELSAQGSDFPRPIVRLRDAVTQRLRLESHADLVQEMDWALLVACEMKHPGIAVLWIRKQAARIVYHRRHIVAELKRSGHTALAKTIGERTVNDDDLIIVALVSGDDAPRSCVLDIGDVRRKRREMTSPAWPGRTL